MGELTAKGQMKGIMQEAERREVELNLCGGGRGGEWHPPVGRIELCMDVVEWLCYMKDFLMLLARRTI